MRSEKDIERMDELEISIKDLALYMCLRWRMILAWMLIGAVMLGGVGVLKMYLEARTLQQSLEMPKEEAEQSKENRLMILKEGLTEIEIAEVECAFEAYTNIIRNSDNIVKYNNESIKMQLNPYAVPTVNLSYYIDNHYQVVYPMVQEKDSTNAILTALTEEVTSVTTCEKMAQELGWEKDSIYVSELIEVGYMGNILSITLMAPKQEDCEVMRSTIMETVKEYIKKLHEVFGGFDIELIEDEYKLSVKTSLLSEQMTMSSGIYTLKNNYAAVLSGLSDSQREYLDELINSRLQKSDEETEEEIGTVENNSTELTFSKLFKIKYVVLGAFIGAALYCFWLVMKYVLSDRLHVAEEMEQRYRVRIMAVIRDEDKERKSFILDKFLYGVFLRGELKVDKLKAVRVIESEIRVLVQNTKMKNIYMASTCGTLECKEIQELVCKNSRNESYTVHGGCDVSCNPEELEALGQSDGVVLVEQVNSSSYRKIKRLICFCEQNQVPIIGCAIVQ